jgi:hypothetical protein
MRTGISVSVTADDRARLKAIGAFEAFLCRL